MAQSNTRLQSHQASNIERQASPLFEHPSPKGQSPSWTNDPFEADVWTSNNPNPGNGGTESISFASLPDKHRLIAKQFLWAVNQTAEHGRRRARSSGTANSVMGMMRHLVVFMERHGIDSLGALTMKDVDAVHLDYCGLCNGGKAKTSNSAKRYLGFLSQLHQLGPARSALIDDGLSFDPSSFSPAIGRSRALRPAHSTPDLAEETAQRLLDLAIDWIEIKSEHATWIIRQSTLLARAKSNVKAAAYHQNAALRIVRQHVAGNPGFVERIQLARAELGGDLIRYLDQRKPVPKPGITDLELELLSLGIIARQLQVITQGFCYVICAGFNGWRSNEILSIEAGSIKSTPAGHVVGTKIRKTALNPQTFIERPIPPIVAKAISVLEKINATPIWLPRQENTEAEADESDTGTPVFKSGRGNLLKTNDINTALSAAWALFSGDDQKITTHQFRRFFAQFYLRRYQGGLDAIRRHFRHVSRDMVWAYAKDALNAEYLAKEKKVLAGEIAKSVVFSSGYTSTQAASELVSLRVKAKTLSVEDAAAYINKRIEDAFTSVHAMEWGYCLLQHGDQGAACEGQLGPIEDRSEPKTCGRCKFLCTGPENVPFWQHTALLHQEIAKHPKATKIMKSESEKILSTAGRILSRHNSNTSGDQE